MPSFSKPSSGAPTTPYPRMLLACFIAVLSVLIGALLGFSRRASTRHIGPIKTFAFAAATAVVATSFLPEAVASLGAVAVVPFALGFLAPRVLEVGFRNVGGKERGAHTGLEVGYVGLSVHQLGDGVGMGALTGPSHEGHHHLDVFLAIGGHTVPVAAIVVLAFVQAKGRFVAARRAAGLAVFVVLGVVLARYLGVSIASRWGGATGALVGGLLLHIAAHDLGAALPKTTVARMTDLTAAALGVLLVAIGGHEAGEDGLEPTRLSDAIRTFGLTSSPYVLAGLCVSLAVVAVAARRPTSRLSTRLRMLPEYAVATALGIGLFSIRAALSVALVSIAVWLSRTPDEDADCAERATPSALRVIPSWAMGVGGAVLAAAGGSPSGGWTLDALACAAIAASAFLRAPAAIVVAAAMVRLGATEVAALVGIAGGFAVQTLGHGRDRRRVFAAIAVTGGLGIGLLALEPTVRELHAATGTMAGIGVGAALLLAALLLRLAFFEGVRGVARSLPVWGGGHDHGHSHDLDVHAAEDEGLGRVSPSVASRGEA